MPQTQTRDQAAAFLQTARQRWRYLVLRRQDAWFIMFKGEEFGPYRSEREAKLFAIDAAHALAEQGEETEVVVANETGEMFPVWIHGQHAYPPRGRL
jgi:hypothetical protein